MVQKLRLKVVGLAPLISGVKHFPTNTPKRWSLVSQFIAHVVSTVERWMCSERGIRCR